MNRYSQYLTNEEIREIQLIQAELLKKFHDFCEEHGLYYIAYSGTVIGSVRHGGFIPWDDDADVLMPRKDYERFISMGSRFIDKNIFVQNPITDKEFPHHFTRLRKDNTLMLQEFFKSRNMHHGVFIDVFPMDTYPLSNYKRKKLVKSLLFHRHLRWLYDYEKKGTWKDIYKLSLKSFLRLFPRSFWFKLAEKSRRRYENEEIHPNLLQLAEFTLEVTKEQIESLLHTKNELYDRILSPFEDFEIYIPRNYKEILNRYFSDYSKFPPIEEQVSHHGIIKFSRDTTESEMENTDD